MTLPHKQQDPGSAPSVLNDIYVRPVGRACDLNTFRFRQDGGAKSREGVFQMDTTTMSNECWATDADAWAAYEADRSTPVRNAVAERYLPLIRWAADGLHKTLPKEVDVNDLYQAGIFGLIRAVERYDRRKGVKFETYSATPIRGAMLDHLRGADWAPRLVRRRTAQVIKARSSLTATLSAEPTAEQMAEHLNVTPAEYRKMSADAKPVDVVSLSVKVSHRRLQGVGGLSGEPELVQLIPAASNDPAADARRADLKKLITKGLDRAERLIVILYYFEQMTMREIGATLDLSESRVSQMHSSILARLKAQLGGREGEFIVDRLAA